MLNVADIIRLVLPVVVDDDTEGFEQATRELQTEEEFFADNWGEFPFWPPDLFAVTSLLIKRTGAYSFVRAGIPHAVPPDWLSRDLSPATSDAFGVIGEDGVSRDRLELTAQAWRHGLIFEESFEDDDDKAGTLKQIAQAIKADEQLTEVRREELSQLCDPFASRRRILFSNRIQKLWDVLLSLKHVSVLERIGPWEDLSTRPNHLKLYQTIIKLHIIADEACTDIGRHSDIEDERLPWLDHIFGFLTDLQFEVSSQSLESLPEYPNVDSVADGGDSGSSPRLANKDWVPIRLNLFTDPALAPILPKGRTTSLGCSLRSISRNVCLAPIRTEVDASWNNTGGYDKDGLFNILMIPFPYEIPDNSFQPAYSEDVLSKKEKTSRWRWFDIHQGWLDDYKGKDLEQAKLISYFSDVVKAATNRGGEVHCVVFPELSLNYSLFLKLAGTLCDNFPQLEMLIAGTSDAPVILPSVDQDKVVKPGNFVCTAVFDPVSSEMTKEAAKTFKRGYGLSVQHKHHRWKLTKEQIIGYGAAHTLNPTYDWWEHTNLSTRTLNFWAFRERSILSTLICEDLARNDPAQQVLRAVGPNLIFALLMDGPQLSDRWPGRYAAMLSEDPGASVLTLTSEGLMRDRPAGGIYTDSTKIALWSEPGCQHRVIEMKPGSAGVLLNLLGSDKSTHSLDGRYKPNTAKEWNCVGVKSIAAPDNKRPQTTSNGAKA